MSKTTPLPTEVRRRVQKALRTRSFRAALRSNTGAIDLASIMVGVIVIGAIAGVIAATVFAVIPWAQNAAAGQGLDAVRTAESVALVQDSKFSDMAGLLSAQRIQPSTTVSVATNAAGSCYVTASRSAAGKVFYSTDTDPTVRPVTALTTSSCVTDVVLAALVTGVGGAATPTGISLAALASGSAHTLALDANGKLWAWGRGQEGQLGDGTNVARTAPVAVDVSALAGASINGVKGGDLSSYALDSSGRLWSWGNNYNGQLGDGTVLARNSMVLVKFNAGIRITSFAAGTAHVIALDSTGKLWSWGYNGDGELGDGTTTERHLPVAVNMTVFAGKTIASLDAGRFSSYALDSNHALWAWGDNSYGELGTNGAVSAAAPQAVAHASDFATVTAGYSDFVTAIDTAGKAWAWGSNSSGQLGDGTVVNRAGPTAVNATALAGAKLVDVKHGYLFSMAKDTNGKLWSWGDNSLGQLGDGTTVGKKSMTAVTMTALGSSVATVFTSNYGGTVMQDSSGKLWAWGNGGQGQIGNGLNANQNTPVPVSAFR